MIVTLDLYQRDGSLDNIIIDFVFWYGKCKYGITFHFPVFLWNFPEVLTPSNITLNIAYISLGINKGTKYVRLTFWPSPLPTFGQLFGQCVFISVTSSKE